MTKWINGIAKITIPTPFEVGDVNVYLIKGERLTLIDVGPNTNEAWNALKDQLRILGVSPNDIEQVVLTHHHPDHVGLLDFFPDSLEIYGHPLNNRWLSQPESFLAEQEPFFNRLCIEFGVPKEYTELLWSMNKNYKYSCHRTLTGELVTGDTPIGLQDWVIWETPGHAQSHIGLFREKDGIFISGDHLLSHISPNPVIEPPLPGETERPKSLLQYNRSLRELFELPIQIVYPGHGEDIFHTKELIKKCLLKQHERAHEIKKWLEKDSLSVFDTCKRLFPKAYKQQMTLTISETIGQFDYLVDLGEIKPNNGEESILRYSIV